MNLIFSKEMFFLIFFVKIFAYVLFLLYLCTRIERPWCMGGRWIYAEAGIWRRRGDHYLHIDWRLLTLCCGKSKASQPFPLSNPHKVTIDAYGYDFSTGLLILAVGLSYRRRFHCCLWFDGLAKASICDKQQLRSALCLCGSVKRIEVRDERIEVRSES